jgi:N-acetylglucosaminyldiphosphoundecaprenol N-acetyl-beta-D-mannosaminyltransferase
VIEQAAEHLQRLYPRLNIVGYRHGYFSAEEEADVVAAINAVRPDILWIGLGVPGEQRFALRHRDDLRVGLIKTAGGLFDFLSGKNRRAPEWMQATGLEWVYRIYLEPRRLLGRYMRTNPHALFLLLTKTRSADAGNKRPEGS